MANTDSTGSTVIANGRIVWVSGDLFAGRQKTDQNTRAPLFKPDGTPKMEYGFGLAIPKSELQQGQQGYALYAALYNEANQIYPSRQYPPAFAWKFKDGDGVDHNGQSFATREGYAGHYIFALTTSLPIKFYRYDGAYIQIQDGIKCGDYVQVQIQVKAHPAVGQSKPGLYLNPLACIFMYHGKEIVNAPSPEQIFGAAPQSFAMPAGASTTPIGQPTMPANFGQQPQGQAPTMNGPMGAPSPAAIPSAPVAPSSQPQPHYGVLPPQFQPQQQPVAQAPAMSMPGAQPQPQMQQQYQQPMGMPQMPGIPQVPGV